MFVRVWYNWKNIEKHRNVVLYQQGSVHINQNNLVYMYLGSDHKSSVVLYSNR